MSTHGSVPKYLSNRAEGKTRASLVWPVSLRLQRADTSARQAPTARALATGAHAGHATTESAKGPYMTSHSLTISTEALLLKRATSASRA